MALTVFETFKQRFAFLGHFRLRRRGRGPFPLVSVEQLVGEEHARAIWRDARSLERFALCLEYRALEYLSRATGDELTKGDMAAIARRMTQIEKLLGLGGAGGKRLLLKVGKEAYRKAEAEHRELRARLPREGNGRALQARRRRLRRQERSLPSVGHPWGGGEPNMDPRSR